MTIKEIGKASLEVFASYPVYFLLLFAGSCLAIAGTSAIALEAYTQIKQNPELIKMGLLAIGTIGLLGLRRVVRKN